MRELIRLRGTEPPPEAWAHLPVAEAEAPHFHKLTDQPSPEGLLAVAEMPAQQTPAALGPAFVLWDVNDPGNLGTLLRTAHWFGHSALYCTPGTTDAFNPRVLRASMGAAFHVPVVVLAQPLEWLAEEAHLTLAALAQAEAPAGHMPPGAELLLLGSEAHGLPQTVLGLPGLRAVTIASASARRPESLNVAAAGAILAYELHRQRVR